MGYSSCVVSMFDIPLCGQKNKRIWGIGKIGTHYLLRDEMVA